MKSLIVPYIRAADEAAPLKATGQPAHDGNGKPQNVLVETHTPKALVERLRFSLPEGEGRGRSGLLDTIQDVLKYSVNTWDQVSLGSLQSVLCLSCGFQSTHGNGTC